MEIHVKTREEAIALLRKLRETNKNLNYQINRLLAYVDQNKLAQRQLEEHFGLGEQPPLFKEE